MRIAGVKVGTVDDERIDPQSFQAVVALTVRNDIKLPKDSAAIITSESLLGGKYLSLQPGGDEAMLQPGQTITITQASVSPRGTLGQVHLQHDQRAEALRQQPAKPSPERPKP